MSVLLALAALLQASAKSVAADSFANVQTLQLHADLEAIGAATADLDGDGRREVLIAARTRDRQFARELEIWRPDSTAPDASGEPAARTFTLGETLTLTPDVVAWAVGDVRAGGGDEVVLFNAGGAFSWRPEFAAPKASPAERFERIAEADFLWQLAEPESVFSWQRGMRDVDGDGLIDLLLPEPEGYAIVLQRRPRTPGGTREAGSAWGSVQRLRVPHEEDDPGTWLGATQRRRSDGRGKGSNRELSFRIGRRGENAGPGLLVQVNEETPVPQIFDWDADGDLDLLAQTSHHLHVWLQSAGGTFDAKPAHSLALPVEADRERRLDASYSAHATDIDGDRRADCAIFAGDKRSEDVRTQGLFFVQPAAERSAGLFGADGRPSALLVFAGFVSDPVFHDIDGDGLPELALHTVRPDLIDQLRSATTETIDAELFVYKNRKGVFAREPDLTWKHEIPLKEFELSSEFCGDLTGDGVSELLVRDDPKRVRAYYVRAQSAKGQGAWSVVEKPLWQLDVHEKAVLDLVRGTKPPELFVIEPSQILYVRFR